jgi:asparagine synthase (glutamine-hydrolysing)
MGGIVGAYGYYNQQPVQEELIRKMARVLKHRGPDDEGEYHDHELALGYRHLNISDREKDHQQVYRQVYQQTHQQEYRQTCQQAYQQAQQPPLFNEDNSKVLVLDGEIYHYRELRRSLEDKGHYFQTDSDAETILHLYEEKGVNFLDDLQGVFSLALWDKHAKRLLLARDRLGVKPLYYYCDGYRLLFASQVKAIFQDKTVARELNPHGVADYFSYLYIPAPKTIFLGIYKLPPGHYLLCSPEGYIVKKYWDLDLCPSPEEKSPEQYQHALLDLLQEAVRCRLPARVQTGLFLSGGIDSATLLGLGHQLGVPLQAQTIGFEEPDLDERPFARILARHFNVPFQEWVLSPKGLLEQLDRLAWYYDEPLGDATTILSYELARLSSQYTRVALSGEEGEGNFTPYRHRRHGLNLWRNSFHKYSAHEYPACKFPAYEYPARKFPAHEYSAREYLDSVSCFSSEGIQRLLGEDFYHDLRGYDPSILFQDLYRKAIDLDPFSRAQYISMKTHLPDNVLAGIDRASMANSLQVRFPLLDHRLVEFLGHVPVHFKLNKGTEEKYLLRKAMEGVLPPAILSRKKQKTDLPLQRWFLDAWRSQGEKYLCNQQDSALSEVLNFTEISSLWQRHQQRRKDYSRQIWAVLFFQRWYHQHLCATKTWEEDRELEVAAPPAPAVMRG